MCTKIVMPKDVVVGNQYVIGGIHERDAFRWSDRVQVGDTVTVISRHVLGSPFGGEYFAGFVKFANLHFPVLLIGALLSEVAPHVPCINADDHFGKAIPVYGPKQCADTPREVRGPRHAE